MRTRKLSLTDSQSGGVTILVALMLLVLLTVSAIAMSRNSLREIIISGTVRQGTEARNVADTGLEWSCFWLTPDGRVTKGDPDAGATVFAARVKELSGTMELSGDLRTVTATGVMTRVEPDGATRSFSLGVIRMGKQQLDLTGGAPSTGAGGMTQAIPSELLPDIWSIRSTGTLDYGGMAFRHVREAWATAPPQGQ